VDPIVSDMKMSEHMGQPVPIPVNLYQVTFIFVLWFLAVCLSVIILIIERFNFSRNRYLENVQKLEVRDPFFVIIQ